MAAPTGRITAMTLLDSWTTGRSLLRRDHPSDVPQGKRPRRHRDPRDPGADTGRDRLRRGGRRGRVHGGDAEPVRYAGGADEPLTTAKSFGQVCVSREFTKLATGVTTPVAGWLRSLARELHDELGGPGVGALGMCFTGGFALAMMVDTSVVAPVLAQPSAPFAVAPNRSRDLNLSPEDLAAVKKRAAEGCEVLGLRFKRDPMVGNRFRTLEKRARRRVHPGGVPRPRALDGHRAAPAGRRRPGAGVLRGEAALRQSGARRGRSTWTTT